MSRDAPPAAPDTSEPTPAPLFGAAWLIAPLAALGLPLAYRLVPDGDMQSALRVPFLSESLTLLWYVTTLTSALALMGILAARRRGRSVWPAVDMLVAVAPWMVALIAASLPSAERLRGFHRAPPDDVLPWGLVDAAVVLARGLNMTAVRGLGALVTAALCVGAALGLLVWHAERPRWSGMRLVIVTLPAWAVAYGYLSSGSLLPFLGVAWLTSVVAFVGTQSSAAARGAGQAAVLLASLAAMALNVSAACETVVASQPFRSPDFFAAHARLYDTLRALSFSSVVTVIPAVLAGQWLAEPSHPATSRSRHGLLAVVVVGAALLDLTVSRMALNRVSPDVWPPWDGLAVTPLPLGPQARFEPRRSESPRLVLTAGELQDRAGRRLAQLSDAAALREAFSRELRVSWEAPRGVDAAEPEAIAPVMDEPPPPVSLCPGQSVSVLFDRSVSMADVRGLVVAAVANGVVEIDVVGPRALSSEAKRALAEVAHVEGRPPTGSSGAAHELESLRLAASLPALAFAPLDIQREPLTAHSALLPGPCWLTQLAHGSGAEGRPSNAFSLWLDPERDVGEFLLAGSASSDAGRRVIWTLESPAP